MPAEQAKNESSFCAPSAAASPRRSAGATPAEAQGARPAPRSSAKREEMQKRVKTWTCQHHRRGDEIRVEPQNRRTRNGECRSGKTVLAGTFCIQHSLFDILRFRWLSWHTSLPNASGAAVAARRAVDTPRSVAITCGPWCGAGRLPGGTRHDARRTAQAGCRSTGNTPFRHQRHITPRHVLADDMFEAE